ncbi:cytokine receptor-like factor 2 [Tachyglossus aculeatus]|uniref:cytokine receptor-like factor 2 n=1 Tax=Tachyglossus aculeatus TaxID=9261 RepID=UPI0018F5BABE|nr:cytokine receptor-like factor 2 [Tachyglossus aculeatus]
MKRFILTPFTFLLLRGLVISGEVYSRKIIITQIINFNFEKTRIDWTVTDDLARENLTFQYTLDGGSTWHLCPEYLFEQGYKVGCLFQASDETLEFSIHSGDELLYEQTLMTSSYIKPDSPKNLTFTWKESTVRIKCPNLNLGDLSYEIQFRSVFDDGWQSQEEEDCDIEVQGLDLGKCYTFRARVRAQEFGYGPDTYPSDWTSEALWWNGKSVDSCSVSPPARNTLYLISGLVTLMVTFLLLLLALWKSHRVKELIVPIIPDPKYIFPGLFDDHRGNFQEWIKETEDLMNPINAECVEEACVIEEELTARPGRRENTVRDVSRFQELPPMDEQPKDSCFPPPATDPVTFGNLKFVTNENMYVVL